MVSRPRPRPTGIIKRDGITDVALANFRKHYGDQTITKEAIFYYCYGVLHSPEYREHYAADLKKVLPRVPYTPDFRAFEKAGRTLAALHLDYETFEPWPVTEEAKPKGDLNDFAYYRVEKMRFASKGGREKDKQRDRVQQPHHGSRASREEAYDYMVNGKSAIEWVMDRYDQVTTDKDSGYQERPQRVVPRTQRPRLHPEPAQARDPREHGDGQDRRRPAVAPMTAEGREEQCPT
jgi:predicted helicase